MTIKLPCFGIVIELGPEDPEKPGAYQGGNLVNGIPREEADPEDDEGDPAEYNAAMDGIESMILAHAIAGIDVASPAYVEGIETAVQACANNL
jgi:hypothetical protein